LVSDIKRGIYILRVLRRIFGPKRNEVMGRWRELHNEGLHDLCFSPTIITIIKLRRMRWTRWTGEEEGFV
jgi:hypothetical protein